MAQAVNEKSDEFSITITAEQQALAEKEGEKIVKSINERTNKVKNDESGLEALKYALDLTNTSTSGDASTDDEKNDKDKGKKKEKDLFKQIFDGLKDFAEQMLHWASNFVKELTNAPLKDDTKKDVIEQCKQYKDLLSETVNTLQQYRLHTENVSAFINAFAKLIVPPIKALDQIKQLPKEEQTAKFNGFASKNKAKAVAKLGELKELVDKQMKEGDNIQALQKKWGQMKDGFEGLQQTVTKEAKEIAEKMKNASKQSGVMGFLSGLVSGVVSFGKQVLSKMTDVGRIIGTVINIGEDLISGKSFKDAVFNGLTTFVTGSLRVQIDQAQSVGIEAVQNGLKKIAENADRVETLLQLLYNESIEMTDKLKRIENAEDTATNAFAMSDDDDAYDDIEGLYQTLFETVDQLKSLSDAIKEAEIVCKKQLVEYTKNIYDPLMDLLTKFTV